MLVEIECKLLNAGQKDNLNFKKSSVMLADYGFNSLRLTDDWLGADFLACHVGGGNPIKIQLNGD